VMIASIPVFTDITGLNDVKAVNAYDSLKAPRPTGGFRK